MRNINVVELARIVNELKKIEGSRLSKIFLPELKLLNLRFNDKDKTSLIIDSGKVLYSTKYKIENPKNPHNFVMYLRKNIDNSRVEEIRQIPGDRIVEIIFKNKNKHVLIIELFGKGNFILTDENYNVKNSARKIKEKVYEYNKKIDPFNFKKEEIYGLEDDLINILSSKLSLGRYYALNFCKKYEYNEKSLIKDIKFDSFIKDVKKYIKNLMKLGIKKLENNFYISEKNSSEINLNNVIDELYNSKFNKKYIVSSKEYIKNEKSIKKQEKLLLEFDKKIKLKLTQIDFLSDNRSILENKDIKFDTKNKEFKIKIGENEISIRSGKTVENKINDLYTEIKKLRTKIKGANETILKLNKKEISKEKIIRKIEKKKIPKWYEKFRWFYTKENNLVLGGRDATTNDILIKKHMEKEDLVFHTTDPGSPFFILKSKNPSPSEINEVSIATASYSKSWSKKIASTEVFYVNSDQVSKSANTGEFLKKGSFMIRGKKNFLNVKLGICIGSQNSSTIGGPYRAISSKTKNYLKIIPGYESKSNIAKKISKKLKLDIDDIMRFLPNGTSKIL